MTAPTPERPLDVEALLRRLRGLSSILDDAPTDGEADDAAAAFVLHRRALLAALTELEGLRAENEELHVQVVGKAFESEQMHAAANSARAALEDGRPDVALSMLRSALAAREAEEVSGG